MATVNSFAKGDAVQYIFFVGTRGGEKPACKAQGSQRDPRGTNRPRGRMV